VRLNTSFDPFPYLCVLVAADRLWAPLFKRLYLNNRRHDRFNSCTNRFATSTYPWSPTFISILRVFVVISYNNLKLTLTPAHKITYISGMADRIRSILWSIDSECQIGPGCKDTGHLGAWFVVTLLIILSAFRSFANSYISLAPTVHIHNLSLWELFWDIPEDSHFKF